MWLSETFVELETTELAIRSSNGSASGFISVGQKTSTGTIKWLGDIHILQEAIRVTLVNGEIIYIPDVKLNSFGCNEQIKPLIPQIEALLTKVLINIQSREENRGR